MRTVRNATVLDSACEAPTDGRDWEAAARPVTRQNTTAACHCFLVTGISISIRLLPAPAALLQSVRRGLTRIAPANQFSGGYAAHRLRRSRMFSIPTKRIERKNY